jgi:hypothetical protein
LIITPDWKKMGKVDLERLSLIITPDWKILMTQGLRHVRFLILMQEFEKGGTESGI